MKSSGRMASAARAREQAIDLGLALEAVDLTEMALDHGAARGQRPIEALDLARAALRAPDSIALGAAQLELPQIISEPAAAPRIAELGATCLAQAEAAARFGGRSPNLTDRGHRSERIGRPRAPERPASGDVIHRHARSADAAGLLEWGCRERCFPAPAPIV